MMTGKNFIAKYTNYTSNWSIIAYIQENAKTYNNNTIYTI